MLNSPPWHPRPVLVKENKLPNKLLGAGLAPGTLHLHDTRVGSDRLESVPTEGQ
ncbi:hypothetical protein P7K49_034577, partial [Saguinus oedipus]